LREKNHNYLPVPCPDGCHLDTPQLDVQDGDKVLEDVTLFAYEAINHVQQ